MKHQKNAIAIALLLSSSLLYAGVPIFSIIPTSDSITAILLPSNFIETVRYQVTNNTKYTRTLTMVPIVGISQTVTGAGVCGSTFTLAPQQGCTLSLIVNGSQVPQTGIKGGPVVCKTQGPNNTPDPSLCAQPNTANVLDVSITSTGQHAYIANQVGNSVSFCQANPVTGLLSQCAITATGTIGTEGVGFNPAGTFFYSANLNASTVTVCKVNQATGALSDCVDTGSGFSQPDAVAFSPDGSVFYTSNAGGTVSACLVDATTGLLSNCMPNSGNGTFHTPSDMALNAAGTLAYVANRLTSTVSICNVSGQTLDSCNDLTGSLFDSPEGVSLSPSGRFAYIANAGNGTVTVCNIRQDGTGLLSSCATTNGQFKGTGNVAFNKNGLLAYVPNKLLNIVFTCQVDLINGSLSECLPSRGTGFDGPSGVVVK